MTDKINRLIKKDERFTWKIRFPLTEQDILLGDKSTLTSRPVVPLINSVINHKKIIFSIFFLIKVYLIFATWYKT